MRPLDWLNTPYIEDRTCPGCGLNLRDSDLMDERNFVVVSDEATTEQGPLTYYDGGPRLWQFGGTFDWETANVHCECGAKLTLWDGERDLSRKR